MPSSLPRGVPSSVTGMVEWPVRSLSSMTCSIVISGVRVESDSTKPALWSLTALTMAASDSGVWEP